MNTQPQNHSPRAIAAIRLKSVTKGYANVQAVRNLNLEVSRGETVALLGPNGAGKSTTISMLMGLVAPDSGEVTVSGLRPREAIAEGKIAAMLQDAGLMPGVTVSELLELARRSYPNALSLGEALDLAGLTSIARRRVDRLSGGQAQRVRFAMAVIANPEILILDEPTRALDVQGRAEFWSSMNAYSASGRTLIFATHYLDEVNDNASRVIVMARGEVIADGDPSEVRSIAGTSTVRFSLHGNREHVDRLPGVTSVAYSADHVAVSTTSPDRTVAALISSDLDWSNLEVTPPSLDESFLLLTKELS